MSTYTDAVAQVYARSLYELAEQAGGNEKILEIASELEQICELALGDQSLAEFLASPIIDKKRRGDSLRRIFSDIVTDLTLRFLLVLNDKRRLDHLQMIQMAFDQLVQEAFGRIEVDIFTPAPLGTDQLDTLRDRIQRAIGKEPVLHTYTDDRMIGGLRLRIGDQLIDGSVATQLRRLRQGLLTSDFGRDAGRVGRMIDDGSAE